MKEGISVMAALFAYWWDCPMITEWHHSNSWRAHLRGIETSDGVSRFGLGLETLLETRFLKSRSRRSRLGLKGFRSRSRALRFETLHRLFFMKFCKKEFL